MPMMPPDTDLKKHLRNLRSLAEARAAYLASVRNREPVLQTKQPKDQIIAMDDPVKEKRGERASIMRSDLSSAFRQHYASV